MWKLLIIVVLCLFLYFYIISLKFANPYKLVMIFGKKGSGKNTLLTKLSVRYNRMGFKVYSDSEIFNTFKLDTEWIGKYDFPPKSVLLVQEAGIVWDNRDFKTFSKEVRNFFKLQRHKQVIVYLCSQAFDIDKKLRDLTDEMYLLVNYMGIFSIAKKINKHIAIHNASENNDGESFLTETFSFDFPWRWKYTYIPRWIRYFNSFECETFPKVQTEKYRFLDEQELYKSQFYRYYKMQQIKNVCKDVENWMNNQKKRMIISDEEYFYITERLMDLNKPTFAPTKHNNRSIQLLVQRLAFWRS